MSTTRIRDLELGGVGEKVMGFPSDTSTAAGGAVAGAMAHVMSYKEARRDNWDEDPGRR